MSKRRPLGVVSAGFTPWGGGRDFIRHILRGLASSLDLERHPLQLLLPKASLEMLVRRQIQYLVPKLRGLPDPPPRPASPWAVRAQLLRWFEDATPQARRVEMVNTRGGHRRYAQRMRPLAMLPCMRPLGRDFPTPWVGYIYDLQHRYHPELFGAEDIAKRDQQFGEMVDQARVIVVHSHAVAAGLQKLYSARAEQVLTLPIAPQADADWLLPAPPGVLAQYPASRPYFLICNQFWVHKDHATAFRAFREFLDRNGNPDWKLICTGDTSDHRDPAHFPMLQKLVVELGLQDRIAILGFISKRDQIELIKHAVAVVQPTLFEGAPGGGVVSDALALGRRLIVSDIAVNQEIADPRVRFFTSGDAAALAAAMSEAAGLPLLPFLPDRLADEADARAQLMGKALIEAIRRAGAAI